MGGCVCVSVYLYDLHEKERGRNINAFVHVGAIFLWGAFMIKIDKTKCN